MTEIKKFVSPNLDIEFVISVFDFDATLRCYVKLGCELKVQQNFFKEGSRHADLLKNGQ